jgi:hypothetical protein
LTIEKRNSPGLEKVFQECMITSGLFETDKFLFVGFNYKSTSGLIAFNKETGDYFLNEYGIVNDLDGGLPLKYAYLSNDSILIGIAYPTDILSHKVDNMYKSTNSKFLNIKSSISEEENPVMVIYKIRKE